MEKFDDDHLPSKEAFSSKVLNHHISDEEYAHAQNVRGTFNIQNMREYQDFYLKSMPSYTPLSLHLCEFSLFSSVSMCNNIRSISILISHLHFLDADVLKLADVFETFRDVSLTRGKFEIETAHYVSAPQMAWDAMLKEEGIALHLISDPAMYRMIESGMRGGVGMISKRHAKAITPGLGPLYNTQQPKSYII